MADIVFFQEILLSFFVGALLGMERQYSKKKLSLGMRTFSLTSILATLTVIIGSAMNFGNWINLIGLLTVIIFSVSLYLEDFRKKRKRGFTTNISLIIAYLLGTMIAYNLKLEAVFLSIIVVIILFSKEKLHEIMKHLTEKEVGDLLEFLILLGIIYPLLPKTIELFHMTIPLMEMWLLVLLISMINFAAFILSRKVSSRQEIELLSFLGGLISAVATMTTLITIFKNKGKKGVKAISGGFLIMASSSTIRNLAIIFVIYPKALMLIGIPLSFLIIFLTLIGAVEIKKLKMPEIKIESPFNVMEGVKLVSIIFIIYLILSAIGIKTNANVLILFALISGLINTTATAISLASMASSAIITLPEMTIAMIIAQLGGYLAQMGLLAMFKQTKAIQKVYKKVLILTIIALAIAYLIIGI